MSDDEFEPLSAPDRGDDNFGTKTAGKGNVEDGAARDIRRPKNTSTAMTPQSASPTATTVVTTNGVAARSTTTRDQAATTASTTTALTMPESAATAVAAGNAAVAAATTTTSPAPPAQSSWNEFSQQRARFKSFLRDTLARVKAQLAMDDDNNNNKRGRENDDDNGSTNTTKRTKPDDNNAGYPIITSNSHAVELLQAKHAQVMALQKSFEQATAETAALEASNDSLRQEGALAAHRLARTSEALRLAGANASKAREDAEMAEAEAAQLQQAVQTWQTVVHETKQAAQLLQDEQQLVSKAAAAAETKILQYHRELAAARHKMNTLENTNAQLQQAQHTWNAQSTEHHRALQRVQDQLEQLTRQRDEQTALAEARQQRHAHVLHDYRNAQTLLEQASKLQADAETAQSQLQATVLELRAANEGLHEQLTAQHDEAARQEERLRGTLAAAEKQAQQYRIEAETAQEEGQRLQLDKMALDKQVAALKQKMRDLERRLDEEHALDGSGGGSGGTAAKASNNGNNSVVSPNEGNTNSHGHTSLFTLPSLTRAAAAPAPPPPSFIPKNACCICYKPSFSLMQACQCGRSECDKRAHKTCVVSSSKAAATSVSHPGTPAPVLPNVFCGLMSSSSSSTRNVNTKAAETPMTATPQQHQ